jgi:5-methylcytosine-specific restriction endonuclease McrA
VNKRRGSPHPTIQTKKAVIRRDGGLCVLRLPDCTGEAQTADHRANRQAGGSRLLNDPAVLVGACALCNGRKEDSTGDEREELIRRGLIVLPAATHEKTLARCKITPVEFPGGEKFYLIDEDTRVHERDFVPF